MTPERFYSTLLRAYPAPFRREYGDGMLEAFRQLHRAHRGSRIAFWRFVLGDLVQSAVLSQIETCRSGSRRFVLEWAAACAFGAVAIALLANALTAAFSYLYHPYLEGVALPPWSYGAILGTALGAAQSAVLHRRFRLGLPWIAASGVGTAIGLEAAIATARIAGPVGYGIVLGGTVGSVQWMALRTRVRGAAWWGLGSVAALSIAMFSYGVSLHTTLDGVNPLSRNPLIPEPGAYSAAVDFLARGLYAPASGTDLTIELAVMMVCGFVTAALTARPLSSIYGHQKRS
jgi:hypothetical protein